MTRRCGCLATVLADHWDVAPFVPDGAGWGHMLELGIEAYICRCGDWTLSEVDLEIEEQYEVLAAGRGLDAYQAAVAALAAERPGWDGAAVLYVLDGLEDLVRAWGAG